MFKKENKVLKNVKTSNSYPQFYKNNNKVKSWYIKFLKI